MRTPCRCFTSTCISVSVPWPFRPLGPCAGMLLRRLQGICSHPILFPWREDQFKPTRNLEFWITRTVCGREGPSSHPYGLFLTYFSATATSSNLPIKIRASETEDSISVYRRSAASGVADHLTIPFPRMIPPACSAAARRFQPRPT